MTQQRDLVSHLLTSFRHPETELKGQSPREDFPHRT